MNKNHIAEIKEDLSTNKFFVKLSRYAFFLIPIIPLLRQSCILGSKFQYLIGENHRVLRKSFAISNGLASANSSLPGKIKKPDSLFGNPAVQWIGNWQPTQDPP